MDKDYAVPITNISLSSADMCKIFCDCQKLSLKKGDVLFRQGEQIHDIQWLAEGQLESYSVSMYGKKKLINILIPNSILSSIQAFSDMPSLATVVAMEESLIYKCDPDLFLDRIVEHKLLHDFMVFLAEKFCMQGCTENMLHLYEKEDILTHFNCHNLTHQQIADFLGCSREYVTRTMKRHL